MRPKPKRLLAFNKPFGVLCQFTDPGGRPTLGDYIDARNIYPAGRLDFTSEGLLLLTGDGALQSRISEARNKLPKSYWAQVEGSVTEDALAALRDGVQLKDGLTAPAQAKAIDAPDLWPRTPPIRERKNSPTSWIALSITEGRNRQVRRMTAAVGFPTLRLIRYAIGPWELEDLAPAHVRELPFPREWLATNPPTKRRTKRR